MVLEKEGVETIQLSPDDTKEFLDAAESGGWEYLDQKIDPEKSAELRAAVSKK